MLIDIDWKRNLEFDKISSTMANKNFVIINIIFIVTIYFLWLK